MSISIEDVDGNQVEIDPNSLSDIILQDMDQDEILRYLELYHNFEWEDPDQFQYAVNEAVSDALGTGYDYEDMAASFWHGDFDLEKFISAMGTGGLERVKLVVDQLCKEVKSK